MKTGIYQIQNKINGKIYVGQAKNITDRFSQHKCKAKKPSDPGYHSAIHEAFRKYGSDAFVLSILEECSVDKLDEREKFWIARLNSMAPNGYNLHPGGQKLRRIEKFCVDCGRPITNKAKERCKECSVKHQSKNLDMKEVAKLVYENHGFEGAGKALGVSGKAVSKWFQKRGLPFHAKEVISWYVEKSGIELPKKKIRKPLSEMGKKVVQCDLDGNEIKTFTSIREAARESGFSNSNIHNALRGTGISHGFLWKRV